MATLLDLRQALSHRFGGFQRATAGVQITEGGEFTGKATGVDATRRLVSSDLADVDLAGTGSDSNATFFDGAWVYIPDSLEQRRVVLNGYIPNVAASTVNDTAATTARVGYLVLHRALSRVVPGGTPFAVHRWPVKDDDRKMGLHTAINKALGVMFMESRLTLTGLGYSTNRYSLAAYPWLLQEGQLIRAYDTATSTTEDPAPMCGGASLRLDGDVPYLIIGSGIASGSTFSVDVWRPRSTWIARGGTWGESTVGLQDDSDQADVSPEMCVSVAEYFICRNMEQSDPAGPTGMWGQRAARIAVAVAPAMRRDFATVAKRDDGGRNEIGDSYAYLARQWPHGRSSWP